MTNNLPDDTPKTISETVRSLIAMISKTANVPVEEAVEILKYSADKYLEEHPND